MEYSSEASASGFCTSSNRCQKLNQPGICLHYHGLHCTVGRRFMFDWNKQHFFDLADLLLISIQLPASFFAYRKQQHRWTCGPVQLWRKAAVDIWASSLPLHCKLDLIFCYFGIRKVATHWVSMGFFCGLVPLSVFTPEVTRPLLPPHLPPHFPHCHRLPCLPPWSTGSSYKLQTTALMDMSLLADYAWRVWHSSSHIATAVMHHQPATFALLLCPDGLLALRMKRKSYRQT